MCLTINNTFSNRMNDINMLLLQSTSSAQRFYFTKILPYVASYDGQDLTSIFLPLRLVETF
jgi:hypothetical protein